MLEARRQRGRRGDRGPGDAVAGRAAKLRPRRRRLHELLRRARRGKLTIYDGREVAPAQATRVDVPRRRRQAAAVRRRRCSAAARPASPARSKMLALAHGEHGKLPWSSLFGDAERTADEGFIVSPRLARMIARRIRRRISAPDVQRLFREGPTARCSRPATGCATRPMPTSCAGSPRRARTRSIAGRPRRGSSRGPAPAPLGGSMTMADLANYRPVKREPLCRPYRVYLRLRAAAAVERGRAAAAADAARADRHRRARPGRSAGLVPVRRGEPADVRRPRPLCRRPGLRRRCRSTGCSTRPMSPRARG